MARSYKEESHNKFVGGYPRWGQPWFSTESLQNESQLQSKPLLENKDFVGSVLDSSDMRAGFRTHTSGSPTSPIKGR